MRRSIAARLARYRSSIAVCALSLGACATALPVQPDRAAFARMTSADALTYLAKAAAAYDAVPTAGGPLTRNMCAYTPQGVIDAASGPAISFGKWYVKAEIPNGVLTNSETFYTVAVTSSPDSPAPLHACLAYRRKAKPDDIDVNAELKNVVTALVFLGVNTAAN